MKGIKLLTIFSLFLILTVLLVQYVPKDEKPPDVIIDVTSEQFKFTPNIIRVSYGAKVTLSITSLDVTHGFQLEELNIFNVIIPAGQTIDVTFEANKRGTFYFYCTVICGTGHSDHLGTLIVE